MTKATSVDRIQTKTTKVVSFFFSLNGNNMLHSNYKNFSFKESVILNYPIIELTDTRINIVLYISQD